MNAALIIQHEPSFQVQNLIRAAKISHGAAMCLLEIENHRNAKKANAAFPKLRRLCEHLHRSRRQVRRYIKELTDKNYIIPIDTFLKHPGDTNLRQTSTTYIQTRLIYAKDSTEFEQMNLELNKAKLPRVSQDRFQMKNIATAIPECTPIKILKFEGRALRPIKSLIYGKKCPPPGDISGIPINSLKGTINLNTTKKEQVVCQTSSKLEEVERAPKRLSLIERLNSPEPIPPTLVEAPKLETISKEDRIDALVAKHEAAAYDPFTETVTSAPILKIVPRPQVDKKREMDCKEILALYEANFTKPTRDQEENFTNTFLASKIAKEALLRDLNAIIGDPLLNFATISPMRLFHKDAIHFQKTNMLRKVVEALKKASDWMLGDNEIYNIPEFEKFYCGHRPAMEKALRVIKNRGRVI